MELAKSTRDLEVLYFRTFHIIEAAFIKELRKKCITPEIGAMLAEISRLKNPRPIELSRSSRRRPQTITAIINRMEMQGLVKKVRNERKTNTYRIRLTGKGLLAYQKVLEIDIFARIIQTLSEEKREQFRECLEELSDRANKSLK